jgi:hypothetical protein
MIVPSCHARVNAGYGTNKLVSWHKNKAARRFEQTVKDGLDPGRRSSHGQNVDRDQIATFRKSTFQGGDFAGN